MGRCGDEGQNGKGQSHDDQDGEGWLGRVGELAGMAALAVAAPGFGEAADVALEGTMEPGEERDAAKAADEY